MQVHYYTQVENRPSEMNIFASGTGYSHRITMPFSQRQLITLTLVLIVISHWMACAWAGTYYLQTSPTLTVEPVTTWLDQVCASPPRPASPSPRE